jgi:hypothetical protein
LIQCQDQDNKTEPLKFNLLLWIFTFKYQPGAVVVMVVC